MVVDENKNNTKKNGDEINLIDLAIILAKRKRLIIRFTVVIAILTSILSLILPPTYRAETKILPPQQGSSSLASQFMSQLGGAAMLIGGMMPIKTSAELCIGLLKSNTVIDRMIDRFDLMKLHKTKSREKAREKVLGTLKAKEDKKTGMIIIGVEDRDPKRSAILTNAFVEELKNINKGLAITEASQRRLFFEEQLQDVKVALTKAEEDMKTFQERTGVLQAEAQAKAVIENIALLRAQIAAKEVELRVLKTYTTHNNPDLYKAEEGLKAMRAELAKLETKGGGGHNPLMPTGRMPSVGTEYLRKMRELKFNETLYELLLKQYELAKLDEARDATVIQIVDKALTPERRVKPKRKLMVIVATLSAFLCSIGYVLYKEYMDKSGAIRENRERIDTLKKYLNFNLNINFKKFIPKRKTP